MGRPHLQWSSTMMVGRPRLRWSSTLLVVGHCYGSALVVVDHGGRRSRLWVVLVFRGRRPWRAGQDCGSSKSLGQSGGWSTSFVVVDHDCRRPWWSSVRVWVALIFGGGRSSSWVITYSVIVDHGGRDSSTTVVVGHHGRLGSPL